MLYRNDPVTNLKTQIENFEFFQGEIQAQHTTAKQGCIILDNTSIKSTLVDIMILWQNAILKAIEDRAL
jgi:dynein heavy chain